MTVHSFSTQYNTEQFWLSPLLPPTYILRGYQLSSYEGHWIKVKVTRAKKHENTYPHNVELLLAITPVL